MTQRRFIAGAVCPRCSEMDKTVMYDTDDGERIRECVSCGYRAGLDAAGNPVELPTRVNQPRLGEQALPHEDEVTVVRIIEANPGIKRRDH